MALALTWGDVDWEAGTAAIGKTVTRAADGSGRVAERPKTAAGRRTVHLMPETVAALRQHRTRQVARRLEFGPFWQAGDVVCDAGDGGILHHSPPQRSLARGCARLGLPAVTFHGFRHGGATLASEVGMPLKAISDRLGHASIAISADRYAHRSAAADRALAEGMARLLEAKDTGS